MDVPDGLAAKLELFRAGDRILRDDHGIFAEPSSLPVAVGQGLAPAACQPVADTVPARHGWR